MSIAVGKMDRGVSSESLGVYLREISHFRPLSRPEERRIVLRMHRGDQAAFRTLVECNLRFVVSEARRYARSGYPIEELINEGNLGLIEAARRFDPNRDVRFLTYAGWWVRQAILAAIAHFGQAFSVPPRRMHEVYRFNRCVRDLAQELGREPSVEEIAARLGTVEAEVRTLMGVIMGEVSLDASMAEGGGFEMRDLIADAGVPPIDRDLMAGAFSRELAESLGQLGDRERLIVERRFGLGGGEPRTLRELSAEFRISNERVRQIEAQALERLRRSRRTQRLRGYLN